MGLKISKVHKVLKFQQRKWLLPFINFCTAHRKAATTSFDKDYYKALVCCLFGKLLENKRKYVDVKFAFTKQKAKQLIRKPTVQRVSHVFNSELLIFFMKKLTVCLDKNIAGGQAVLDISKILMYEFHYFYMTPLYKDFFYIVATDTDSFFYYIVYPNKDGDFYADMKRDSVHYDLSEYSVLDKIKPDLYDSTNMKVVGVMKDHYSRFLPLKIIALKPKMYALVLLDCIQMSQVQLKKAKGFSKNVIKNTLKFNDYRKVLQCGKNLDIEMTVIRSIGHEVQTLKIRKSGLNAFDSKRIYIDSNNSIAHGHYQADLYN